MKNKLHISDHPEVWSPFPFQRYRNSQLDGYKMVYFVFSSTCNNSNSFSSWETAEDWSDQRTLDYGLMSLGMTLRAPRYPRVGHWGMAFPTASWSMGYLSSAAPILLLMLVIPITGGNLPARAFLLHPHQTAPRMPRRTLQRKDSVGGTQFGIRGILRGTVTTRCGWNQSSRGVELASTSLSTGLIMRQAERPQTHLPPALLMQKCHLELCCHWQPASQQLSGGLNW